MSRLFDALRYRAARFFSLLAVHGFYRRVEIHGRHRVPAHGPVLLCANHSNALVDAVIVQAAIKRPVRPLARSGLFVDPKLKLPLAFQGAVPVFRPGDPGVDPNDNQAVFSRCFEILRAGGVLLIFPEGQSHSDPALRPIKTGAARIALGARAANGVQPAVLPVGITFTRKGRFRGGLLVQIGSPIALPPDPAAPPSPDAVRTLTRTIDTALRRVTMNLQSWQELDLLSRAQRFLALRRRRVRDRSLAHRYRTLARLRRLQSRIRRQAPDVLDELHQRLIAFEQLCDRLGVRDYQLTLTYTPGVIARFALRIVLDCLILLPIAVWGVINSLLPYGLSRLAAARLAASLDQRDSAAIAAGFVCFGLFWSIQTGYVIHRFGTTPGLLYAVSLPPSAIAALTLYRERRRIRENLTTFWLFVRRRDLQARLRQRLTDLETRLLDAVRASHRSGAAADRTPLRCSAAGKARPD